MLKGQSINVGVYYEFRSTDIDNGTAMEAFFHEEISHPYPSTSVEGLLVFIWPQRGWMGRGQILRRASLASGL